MAVVQPDEIELRWCVVCQRPLDGRPNRRTCSANCRRELYRQRHAELDPRAASSPGLLAVRVSAVARAWNARDERALRAELRELAAEAGLWARTDPLLPGPRENRLRIAAEREAT